MAPEIFRRRVGASDRGAEMGKMKWEKCSFCTSFCQISSNRNPKFPPTQGVSGFRQGAVAPSGPPQAPRHHCFEAPPCHKDNQK